MASHADLLGEPLVTALRSSRCAPAGGVSARQQARCPHRAALANSENCQLGLAIFVRSLHGLEGSDLPGHSLGRRARSSACWGNRLVRASLCIALASPALAKAAGRWR
ncbi:hypothetical protein [Frankia casuarinae]|uniref:hypothetical protein n=1 Tax=Frankia casuarinae (strain DSM 45818 / CECT 9043 / HFP020203 / CcI3) TaxID=106370 RepID=UPI0010566FBF|nr:hypothetical protein [Frankia casuarinae]